jgi:alkanesulfonate monooxygenase SsuD/methylene tetrahydromethanopterin reductase-like flavin-dependent oxidoreductase (luciferase family)
MSGPRRPGFGVMLPTFDSMSAGIPNVAAAACEAEDLGFDSLWVGDHLFFHKPNVEAIVAVAAAAGATSRIGIGTSVLLPPLRDPVVLAKQVSSLHAVSGGRFMMGIGVGGEYEPEWRSVGVPVSERGVRTDEVVSIVQAALSGKPVSMQTQHYSVDMPAMLPAPSSVDDVPIWVGGRADAALRRAARIGEGWLTVWTSVRRMQEAQAQLAAYAEEYGRPKARACNLVWACLDKDVSAAREQAAAFVRGHYDMPFENMEKWVLCGPPDKVAEGLAEFRAAGVEDFVLFPMAPDPTTQYEQARVAYELLEKATS